jgi:lipopolysaccharide transport system permease protein
MVVLLAGLLATTQTLHWTLVLVPVVLMPALLVAMGVSWFLASLGTYVRDVGQFVGVAMQAVLFTTPIFWPAHAAPEFLRPMLWVNPLAPVVEGFRRVVLYGQMPDFAALGVWTVLGGVVAWAGYVFFVYTKRGFADVI